MRLKYLNRMKTLEESIVFDFFLWQWMNYDLEKWLSNINLSTDHLGSRTFKELCSGCGVYMKDPRHKCFSSTLVEKNRADCSRVTL